MAELSDAWSAAEKPNLWGTVPEVIEMQSEAGAAGTLHGATTRGALATTFTASQGLLLMLPNMFKIAGRTLAGRHPRGGPQRRHPRLCHLRRPQRRDGRPHHRVGPCWRRVSVQEAADFALVSHAATLESRVPFLHFFDGFRTSHEIASIEVPTDATWRHWSTRSGWPSTATGRSTPTAPSLRGTAQNPDVFFQAREAGNPLHDAVPGIIVERTFERLGAATGRHYGLVDYDGRPTPSGSWC
jgi:pyruvate-ferredoxin/flavodoxin oxidoreductase